MSNDIDILQEALDLEISCSQHDLAHMGFNDCVEQEANRTRELHELKPASWFASVFNTDGELKRREESVKISMALTHAKEKKEVFQLWKGALEPSKERFLKGPYQKVISTLKKHYKSVVPKEPSVIRNHAVMGDLEQRNALLWAYSTRAQQQEFKKLQGASSACAMEMAGNAKKMSEMPKPSLFSQIFNTPANRAYTQEKKKIQKKQDQLKSRYQELVKQREALREPALSYSLYGAKIINKYEHRHSDLKQHQEQADGLSDSANKNNFPLVSPSKKKTAQELWGIAPGSNSAYNANNDRYKDHPYALDNSLNPKKITGLT